MKPLKNFTNKSHSNKASLQILAKKLAKNIRRGDVVALVGELGAGKTTFVSSFLEALGVDDVVSSPTFTLLNIYKTKKFSVYHFDLYRLNSYDEFEFADFYDLLHDKKSVVFVEWADTFPEVGSYCNCHLAFHFTDSEDVRLIEMTSPEERLVLS
ncbi:tRNA (adenosine(37)-N6)-threonylcarbamoyltransferase complex ATPase subunit type 1 TsaE [Candidatus Margulisiibacteriota bacterium]